MSNQGTPNTSSSFSSLVIRLTWGDLFASRNEVLVAKQRYYRRFYRNNYLCPASCNYPSISIYHSRLLTRFKTQDANISIPGCDKNMPGCTDPFPVLSPEGKKKAFPSLPALTQNRYYGHGPTQPTVDHDLRRLYKGRLFRTPPPASQHFKLFRSPRCPHVR